MEVHRIDTYRLEPTADQHNHLKRMAGWGRFVWNRALELIQTYRAWGEGVPRYNAVEAHLAQWKRVFPWLVTDGHSQALQQRLRDLDQAWAAALDPEQPDARPPRFKARGSGDTIRFPQGVAVRGAQVKLPKIGRVRFRKSRNLPEEAEVRSVVVTRDGGALVRPPPDPLHRAGSGLRHRPPGAGARPRRGPVPHGERWHRVSGADCSV